MTVAKCSLMSSVWACFPCQVPTVCLDSIVSLLNFVGSRVCAYLGVTHHLHFWQNDRGLLHATAVTQGGMDTE